MIELKNVSKVYESKKGLKCYALQDVTLSLGDSGMVFLLGKSGSGKTTLLNIIGGLDTVSSGELFFQDEKVGFNDFDLDQYRNANIGFIFQEFNLLETETIKQNLGLALLLQNKKIIDEAVYNCLKYVQLEGYEERFPSELSSGQKQRIAIARAIIKDSKLILADEPTGNLDSETSDSIFKLLKEISKEKLVVVVTHDKEYAEKFGDRIIEIKDGNIINDNIVIKAGLTKRSENRQDSKMLAVFPTSIAFKMGFRNLFKKKAKTLLTITIAILSIVAMGFAHILSTFSSEEALAKTFQNNDIRFISIYQNSSEDIVFQYSEWDKINNDTYAKVLHNHHYIKKNNQYYTINSKQDIINLGFSFHNAKELDDYSVYLTDFLLDREIYYGLEVSENNVNFEPYNPAIHTYENLIGKYVTSSIIKDHFKIAGIVKTDYKYFYDDTFNEYKNMQAPYTDEKLYFAQMKFQNQHILENVYVSENYIASQTNRLSFYNSEYSVLFHNNQDYHLRENQYLQVYNLDGNVENILTTSTLLRLKDIDLKSNEIIISMNLYNMLFNNELVFNEYIGFDEVTSMYIAKKYPSKINKKIKLKVQNKENDSIVFENVEFTIVGVAMSNIPNMIENNYFQIYLDNETMIEHVKSDFHNSVTLLKLSDDYQSNYKLLTKLRREYNVVTDTIYSRFIYDNEQFQRNLGITFWMFALIMAIITTLSIISLISFSIMDQRREIGIIRALGSRTKDVLKIYLLESFVISSIVFVCSLVLCFAIVLLTNVITSKTTLPNITFISVQIFAIVIIFISSLIVINLATLIPVRKVSKMKPIDAIKEI